MMRTLLSVFFLFIGMGVLMTQVTEELLRQQLEERGIEESVFRQKLQERGVTYQSLEEVPPEQYPEMERIVQEILAEIEREQAQPDLPQSTPTEGPGAITPAEVEAVQSAESAVLEGESTVEEAVTEAVAEQQTNAPPAKIYGQEIFRNQTLKVFRQADNIKPRNNYLLGVGDELTISIWGVSIFERTYTIDENGYIAPAQMPRIYLKDLTYEDARSKLMRSFRAFNQFTPDQFEVSLRYARTISIGIFGEVFNPGNHTISAINSAFNALVAAGGPTDIGTLRNIRWIKDDGTVRRIDVYEYMNDPTIADQFYLHDNDILQIPIAERIVGIGGAVNRPMRYELVEGENLMQLIEYAGGFTPNAYKQNIQLRRYENDEQVVIDIPLNQLLADSGDFILRNGDQISIRNIPTIFRNFVSITGMVELGGEYELVPTMRVSDLIAKGKLREESERSYAVLRRNNRDGTYDFIRLDLAAILANPLGPENIILAPGDRLQIYNRSTFVDEYTVNVTGQVRQPGALPFDPSLNMRVRDAIMMAGGLQTDATDFAYIVRRDLATGEVEYISLDVRNAWEDPNSNDNIVLLPRDELRIQSKANFIDGATVTIGGSVRNPGSYTYDESLTIKDLVTLANGLRLEAASNRVEVSRIVIEENQPTQVVIATLQLDDNWMPIGNPGFELEPYDQVYVRTVPEFEFQKTVSIGGEVAYPGPYTLITDNERLTSIIERAGGLTDEAFPEGATLVRSDEGVGPIVIELDRVLNNENSESNIIMKAGDRIEIPKIKDFVAVAGAVKTEELYRTDLLGPDNRVTVVFDGRRSALHYIDKFAGGFSENGDRRKVTVEYPNGEIRKVKDFGLFRVYPKVEKGAIVKVGTKDVKPEREGRAEGEDIDWGGVLADAVAQATAVLTLILLIDRAGR